MLTGGKADMRWWWTDGGGCNLDCLGWVTGSAVEKLNTVQLVTTVRLILVGEPEHRWNILSVS